MSKKIYVGNLPFSVTLERLKELFSPYGQIEDAIVMANKYTGRSRGFGFVTFSNDGDADKAIAEMNHKSVEGRDLKVKEAIPLKERSEEQKASGESEQKKEEAREEPKESKTEENPEEVKKNTEQ